MDHRSLDTPIARCAAACALAVYAPLPQEAASVVAAASLCAWVAFFAAARAFARRREPAGTREAANESAEARGTRGESAGPGVPGASLSAVAIPSSGAERRVVPGSSRSRRRAAGLARSCARRLPAFAAGLLLGARVLALGADDGTAARSLAKAGSITGPSSPGVARSSGLGEGGGAAAIVLRLVRDSETDSRGSTLYRGELERTETASGSAAVSGRVAIACDGGLAALAGERVRATGLSLREGSGFPRARRVDSLGFPRDPGGFLDGARALAFGGLLDLADRFGGRAAALAKALLLGRPEDLDPAFARTFREAGCLHVLALSGQHLAVIAGLVCAALARFLPGRHARSLASVAVLAYAWLTGFAPSVTRAALMFVHARLGPALGRAVDPLSSLCFAFLVQSSLAPDTVRSASFVLSYLALLGILVCSRGIAIRFAPWLPVPLRGPLSAAAAAQAFASAYTVPALGSFAPAGILASVASSKPVEWFMYAAVASMAIVAACPAAAPACAFVLEALAWLVRAALGPFSALPRLDEGPPREDGRRARLFLAWLVVAAAAAIVYARPHVGRWLDARKRRHG